MKQPLKSENQTILFDGFVCLVYRSFFKKLLQTQQVKKKRVITFKSLAMHLKTSSF